MYQHYAGKTIPPGEFAELLAKADEQENEHWPELIRIEEVDPDDDRAIDWNVGGRLDFLDWSGEDNWRRQHGMRATSPDLDSHLIFKAADVCGLTLGTVYDSPESEDKVVAFDYGVCTDAAAWASAGEVLPAWILTRFRRLLERSSQSTTA